MSLQKICNGRANVSILTAYFSCALFRRLTLGVFFFSGLQSSIYAANHYIRAGASGVNDGSSWTDAWPSFAAATAAGYIRGDTYYIAGGNYNEDVVVAKTLSGSIWIYLKKANAADNSGDVGWNVTYETNQAVINGRLWLQSGYIELNGVTGSGTTGHGIKINNPAFATVFLLDNGTGPYTVSHCEIKGAGYSSSGLGFSGITHNNVGAPNKNTHISYCWIHEVTSNGVIFLALVGTSYTDYGFLFENNVISETGGCTDPSNHGQGMQLGFVTEMGYCIIRNNVFRNIRGSGMIVWLGGTGANHHDIQIYNNLFYTTDLTTYDTISPGVIWAEAERNGATGVALTNVVIMNNTFWGIGLQPTFIDANASIVLEAPTTNVSLINNLWENCRMTQIQHLGITYQSNNGYFNNTLNVPTGTPKQINGTSTTFVNAVAGDFRLAPGGYAIRRGRNFPGVFTTDIAGLTRGGVWDLGAYQTQTTADAAPTAGEVTVTVLP